MKWKIIYLVVFIAFQIDNFIKTEVFTAYNTSLLVAAVIFVVFYIKKEVLTNKDKTKAKE
ncbi:MAG: hypothetical protein JKX79_07335 [Labilibaculum sp.]|nr:hypothetical protein [Labilibaculum sp.]